MLYNKQRLPPRPFPKGRYIKVKLAELCLVLGMLLPATAYAAPPPALLTLAEAVRRGINTSPEYGVAAHQKNEARQLLLQARSGYFPAVDLQAQGGRQQTVSPLLLPNRQNLWERQGSLTLTQLLFDGFGTAHLIKSQAYGLASADEHVREVSEFLGLDIVQAYLDVLRQRALLKIARVNVDDHLKILDSVKAGFAGGTGTAGDVAQVEARLGNARATVAAVQRNLVTAEDLFLQKTGEMPGNLVPPPVPVGRLPKTVDVGVQEALLNNPTLAISRAKARSALEGYRETDAALYPKVDFEVNGANGFNESGIRGSQRNVSALVVMTWNLYHGGGDEDRRREYMQSYLETTSRTEQTARQVEKDFRDTEAALDSAKIRSIEFAAQSKADRKVVSVYLDQFKMSRRTLLDVLDAQNELFNARSNHMNEAYAAEFAVYRLLALDGKMLGILGVSSPHEARLEH